MTSKRSHRLLATLFNFVEMIDLLVNRRGLSDQPVRQENDCYSAIKKTKIIFDQQSEQHRLGNKRLGH